MRIVFILSMLSGLCFLSCSRDIVKASPANPKTDQSAIEEDRIICVVEKSCQAPEDWQDYLKINLELDSLAVDSIPAGSYKVNIAFIVNREGRIEEARAMNDPGYGLAQRAINIFTAYKGKWITGMRNGRPVKNYLRQPLVFVIEEEDTCADNFLY